MRYLVDTNVLSELTKPSPNAKALQWLNDHTMVIAVNPIILGEIEFGIGKLPIGQKKSSLRKWFDTGLVKLHVIPIDRITAHIWAQILVDLRLRGLAMPIKDSIVAATAVQYDLTIATRNMVDFQHCGVTLFDPFADA